MPSSVKFDSKGNLYAIDLFTGDVYQIDVSSGKKTVVATVGPAVDNMAFNSKDELFVSSMDRGAIYNVDVKTGKVQPWVEAKLGMPMGLAVVGEMVYVADDCRIVRVDGNTGEITTVGLFYVDGMASPSYLGSVKNDVVVLTSGSGMNIQVFDLKTRKVIKDIKGFIVPYGVLQLDDNSYLVAVGYTGNLLRVSGDAGEQRQIVTSGLVWPSCLAFASKDAVYLTEIFLGTVDRIDLSTGKKTVVASGLSMPEGIAVQSDGKILVVEAGKNRLVEVDPVSGAINSLIEGLAVRSPYIYPPPACVVVSDTGAIYVSGPKENVLYKITHK
jgi:outer membrane protein assembly factor BamB